jgi:hypothetical protein
MKKTNIKRVLGVVALLIIICILAGGGLVFWALKNPEISKSLKQITATFTDMVDLQKEVIAAFPSDSVQVNINNGHVLAVSLVNPNANNLPEGDQRGQARVIALFIKDHYAHINSIDTIVVAFVQQRGGFGLTINMTNNYVFKLSELQ